MAKSATVAEPVRRKPGRPPDVNGEDTKQEIRRVAGRMFATHGYAGTTTRGIAEAVGVTPAALHHYFGRKVNLVLSLWHATTGAEFARLDQAVEAQDTFVAKVHALIDAALESLRSDPESTRFIVSIREEARRSTELAEILEDKRLVGLVRKVVQFGVDSGDVEKANAAEARGVLGAILLGTTMMATDISKQRIDQMAQGCHLLVDGALFKS